jgi:hypothetical protein
MDMTTWRWVPPTEKDLGPISHATHIAWANSRLVVAIVVKKTAAAGGKATDPAGATTGLQNCGKESSQSPNKIVVLNSASTEELWTYCDEKLVHIESISWSVDDAFLVCAAGDAILVFGAGKQSSRLARW